MPWQQGGGPWGGGGGGGNSPWGKPSGGGPLGSGPQPPNIEDLIRRSQEKIKNIFPGGRRNSVGIAIAAAVIAVLWLGSGFFRIEQGWVGVKMIFGQPVAKVQDGLSYNLPRPIGSVLKVSTQNINAIDIGVRNVVDPRTGRSTTRVEEGQMLTGDENILDIQYTVFWRVNEPMDYLFNIAAAELTVRAAAESAMREIVGNMKAQDALALGRAEIETRTRELLQRVLTDYKSGIEIRNIQLRAVEPPAQVIDAFRDVQRAQADRERQRNEAESYRNGIVPEARGQAQRLIQDAEAYKQQIVAQAQGEAQRFTSVLGAYRLAPEVTKRRLYLEMMEEMLAKTNKVFIDQPAGGQGVVPFLPLQDLIRRGPPPPPGQPGTQAQPGQPATGARP